MRKVGAELSQQSIVYHIWAIGRQTKREKRTAAGTATCALRSRVLSLPNPRPMMCKRNLPIEEDPRSLLHADLQQRMFLRYMTVDVPHWFSDWVATTLPEIQQSVRVCCKRSSVYDARTFRYREGMRDISLKVWELKIGEIAIPSERR